MSRFLCVAVVLSASLLSWAGPASAGMSEGVAAATVGDYDKAIAEFQPLASAGDPAAQYQLAKIYLEGRGPADGVAQGIALMNKAASGGYPEAQAQLGLMYAMGLGVDVDNMQAYDWLTKAIAALPAGTRRTVAEANRDAVMKRMDAAQQNQVAAAGKAKPAATTATTTATTAAKPAATQEAAKNAAQEAAAKETAAKATTAKATTAKATTAAATTAKATPAAATTKTVTEAAATNKTTKASATGTTASGTTTGGTTASGTTTGGTTASGTTTAKAPEKPAQVASAKASADAPSPADQKAAPSGVRIQLISMPSEDAAWAAWKQLSGKYSGQLSGLTAIVEPADLGDKGKFYRVQTGPFTTVAAAQERCTAMKEAGLDCLVVGKP